MPDGRRRLARDPVAANLLLPLIFLVPCRFPFDAPKAWRVERAGVRVTNAAVAAILLAPCFVLGFARSGLCNRR